jgi:protein-S-isoprenylcysteine O-methyltransferase Ste14
MAVSADRVARMEGRSTRVLVAVTIVIVVVVDALYVAIVVNQDPRPPELFTIPFIACYLLLMVVVLAVSLMHRWSAATRKALRAAAAAGGLLVLGVLALFSIAHWSSPARWRPRRQCVRCEVPCSLHPIYWEPLQQ